MEVDGKEIITVAQNRKSILIFFDGPSKTPTELVLNSKYGTFEKYFYCDSKMIVIGYESGYVVGISTNPNQIGKEIFQCKLYKDCLRDITVSQAIGKVVSCGDYEIKVQELSDLQVPSDNNRILLP